MPKGSPEVANDLSQLQRALHALRRMRERLDSVERARSEPIAVVGMACRFPGGADTPERFWSLLRDGTDGITEVPATRWDVDAVYHPDSRVAGRMSTRWGGFLTNIDHFDPDFFSIAPREAHHIDPQQRLLLEVAWEALENAGEPLDRLAGGATGVFIGAHSHSSDYALLQLRQLDSVGTYTSTGSAHSILANRISYWLDLHGPSLTVDTACSSSLVAVHLAVQSLRAGECDRALAGGVNLILSPEVSVALSQMGMMAADGRCKAFDARADGFVRGEGCGLVVLKRYSDAVASGDPVLALIVGSATNQDGTTNGLTAPNGLAQREVVARALRDGRVDPSRIGYVETHGTGTSLGDPIEVEALSEALGTGDLPCALGAVKTNIGHLEGAAGIAGLIKAILALRHETIPANLHFTRLNPHISLRGSRFVVPSTNIPWPADTDRHAGISSFGFGGTNAHVILREPDAPAAESGTPASGVERIHYLLPVSARSRMALVTAAERHAGWLRGSGERLPDICHTASLRRTHHPERLAVLGRTPQEMAAALEAFIAGEATPDVVVGRADLERRRRLIFVYSGMGSQWVGMGRDLYRDEPVFRAAIESCDAHFRPLSGWSLVTQLTMPVDPGRADRMDVMQPVLFALQVALTALWRSWGITPDAIVGHSMGEVAGAHTAGALDLATATRVIFHRGRLMQEATGLGSMAAVGLSAEATRAVLSELDGIVSIAAVNGPGSTIIAGDRDAVEAAVLELDRRGCFTRLLPIPLASHSPHMDRLQPRLVEALEGLAPAPAIVPIYSTVTGRIAGSGDFDASYFGSNLRDPVLFADAIGNAALEGAADYLEVSPHPVMRTALEQLSGGGESLVLGSLARDSSERAELLRTAGALHAHGYAVDWSRLHPSGGAVVQLPNHPWRHRRYWLDSAPAGAAIEAAAPTGGQAPFPGVLLRSPAIHGHAFEARLTAESIAYLGEHVVGDDPVLPAAAYVGLAAEAARDVLGSTAVRIGDLAIHHPLRLPADVARVVQTVLSAPQSGRQTVEVHSRGEDPPDRWVLHATATMEPPRARGTAGDPAAAVRRWADVSSDPAEGGSEDDHPEGAPLAYRVERLAHRPGEAMARIRLLNRLHADLCGPLEESVLLDACVRFAADAAAPASGDASLILASVEHVDLHQRLPAVLLCHASAVEGVADERGGVLADLDLFDEAGVALGRLGRIRFAPIPAVAVRSGAGVQQSGDDLSHELTWRKLRAAEPGSATATSEAPPGTCAGRWVLVGGEAGLTRALTGVIRAGGGEVVAVTGAEDAAGAAARWAHQAPAVALRVIDLRGSDRTPEPETAGGVLSRAIGLCAGARTLAVSLGQLGTDVRPRLWLASRSAQAVRDADPTDPTGATLWGFGRSIALEAPDIWGGLIDLSVTGSAGKDAEAILSAVLARGDEDQIAIRSGVWFVPRVVPVPDLGSGQVGFRAGASYLIAGGLGTLGLELARWLARSGAGAIVLLSRTGMPARAQWRRFAEGTPQHRRAAAIGAIEEVGAAVTTIAADVSDEDAMAAVFGRFGSDLPPLGGVFHAAMVSDFVPLPRLSDADLEQVLRPKVKGAWVLHQLTRGVDLDHFVLFSSVAGLWGSRGLAHYCGANQFLDSLAHHRRAMGLPALSVDWGGWRPARAARGVERFLEQSDFRLLESGPALERLGVAMTSGRTQVAIASVDWSSLRASYTVGSPRLLFSEVGFQPSHGPSDNGSSSARSGIMPTGLASLPREDGLAWLTGHVRTVAAEVLGLDPDQVLDTRRGFFTLGMDSLMTVELRARFERSLGVRLPTTIALEYPTVEALAGFLAESILPPAPAGDPVPAAPGMIRDPAGPPELEALSEAELATILDGALVDLIEQGDL